MDLSAFERLEGDDGPARAAYEAGLPVVPRRGLAVLTCMDTRVHPLDVLGLGRGDVHVIANAGGRASADALRSLAVSVGALEVTAVAVIHHTDCGMMTDEDGLHERLRAADVTFDDDLMTFLDLEASVRTDVARVRGALPDGVAVRGYVFDVATGNVRRVAD